MSISALLHVFNLCQISKDSELPGQTVGVQARCRLGLVKFCTSLQLYFRNGFLFNCDPLFLTLLLCLVVVFIMH